LIQHRETAADVGRDGKGLEAFVAADVEQIALIGIGHRRHLLGRSLGPDLLPQPVVDDQELRHGLGRRARLGHHQHQGLGGVELLQGAPQDERVDVVQHPKLRRHLLAPEGARPVDGGIEGGGPQRRAPDSQQQHGAISATMGADVARHLLHRSFLEGQSGKTEFPGVNPGDELLHRRPGLLAMRLEVGPGKPVAAAHQLGAQIRPVVA
jgi:hypothetical protein